MLELSFMPSRLRSAVKFHSVCLVRSIEAFAFMFPKTCVHSLIWISKFGSSSLSHVLITREERPACFGRKGLIDKNDVFLSQSFVRFGHFLAEKLLMVEMDAVWLS